MRAAKLSGKAYFQTDRTSPAGQGPYFFAGATDYNDLQSIDDVFHASSKALSVTIQESKISDGIFRQTSGHS